MHFTNFDVMVNRLSLQTAKGGGLTGSLPSSIGELSRLAWLDFSSNKLTGNLPALPATARGASLQSNSITNNGFPEAVPASYGETLMNMFPSSFYICICLPAIIILIAF